MLAQKNETEYGVIVRNRSGQYARSIDYRCSVNIIKELSEEEQSECVAAAFDLLDSIARNTHVGSIWDYLVNFLYYRNFLIEGLSPNTMFTHETFAQYLRCYVLDTLYKDSRSWN